MFTVDICEDEAVRQGLQHHADDRSKSVAATMNSHPKLKQAGRSYNPSTIKACNFGTYGQIFHMTPAPK